MTNHADANSEYMVECAVVELVIDTFTNGSHASLQVRAANTLVNCIQADGAPRFALRWSDAFADKLSRALSRDGSLQSILGAVMELITPVTRDIPKGSAELISALLRILLNLCVSTLLPHLTVSRLTMSR